MDSTYLSALLGQWGALKSQVAELRLKIWESLLSILYGVLPTKEGELDNELESNVRDGLLFVGVRFRTFNHSVSTAIGFALFTAALTGIALVILALIGMNPSGIIDIVGVIVIVIGAICLILSIIAIGWANIVVILYAGALARFALERIRTSIQIIHTDESNTYHCVVNGAEDYSSDTIRVYKNNYEAWFRIYVYLLLGVGILLIRLFSSVLLQWFEKVLSFIPSEELTTLPFLSQASGIVKSIDALLPIDLLVLTEPDSLYGLTVVMITLFGFAVFLNWKKIAQHAVKSQFEWSKSREYTWSEEFERCKTVTQILFFQLLRGSLKDEFEIIRGQIIRCVLSLCIITIMTYLYLALLLESL